MAAKIEEYQPQHIKSYAESTNDTVTTEQIIEMEIKVCETLGWNFDNQITFFDWATWFMQRWDDYVDESLSYLKQQFQLKFFEVQSTKEATQKFFTLMNFVDILALSYEGRAFCPRMLVACAMYLVIGGKDIMCAFQLEYAEMYHAFLRQLPIPHANDPAAQQALPEGIQFYNQIIEPFFVNEFGYYLQDLIEPLKFAIKFFVLNIEDNKLPPQGLIDHCSQILAGQLEIALSKPLELVGARLKKKEFSEAEVFENVSEFFSF